MHGEGRASVALHTEMFFAQNPTEEDAFVLTVDNTKLSVIVPRFGIEGTVRMLLSRSREMVAKLGRFLFHGFCV